MTTKPLSGKEWAYAAIAADVNGEPEPEYAKPDATALSEDILCKKVIDWEEAARCARLKRHTGDCAPRGAVTDAVSLPPRELADIKARDSACDQLDLADMPDQELDAICDRRALLHMVYGLRGRAETLTEQNDRLRAENASLALTLKATAGRRDAYQTEMLKLRAETRSAADDLRTAADVIDAEIDLRKTVEAENARQAETIAKLREAAEAMVYAQDFKPGDDLGQKAAAVAWNKLREALKGSQ